MPISYKEIYECQKFAGRSLTGYVLMKVKKNLNKIFVLFLTALATGAFYA
jgi:hypothetical protein